MFLLSRLPRPAGNKPGLPSVWSSRSANDAGHLHIQKLRSKPAKKNPPRSCFGPTVWALDPSLKWYTCMYAYTYTG